MSEMARRRLAHLVALEATQLRAIAEAAGPAITFQFAYG